MLDYATILYTFAIILGIFSPNLALMDLDLSRIFSFLVIHVSESRQEGSFLSSLLFNFLKLQKE
jgi:hypothetical protein